jgi:hypothetical protein
MWHYRGCHINTSTESLNVLLYLFLSIYLPIQWIGETTNRSQQARSRYKNTVILSAQPVNNFSISLNLNDEQRRLGKPHSLSLFTITPDSCRLFNLRLFNSIIPTKQRAIRQFGDWDNRWGRGRGID